MAIKNTTYLILTLLVFGCAAKPLSESDNNLHVGKIRIDAASNRSNGSVETISRCSGFTLSENEVRNFLLLASRVKDDGADKYYRILPCSATGNAVINKRKYNWLIRAGGVGELSSGDDRYVAICGKKCCDKIPGLC